MRTKETGWKEQEEAMGSALFLHFIAKPADYKHVIPRLSHNLRYPSTGAQSNPQAL
jgi:hypothetical protein